MEEPHPYLNDRSLNYGAYSWQTTTNRADALAWQSAIHTLHVTTMTSPKPGAALTSSTVTLKWLAYPGAPNYDIAIYDTLGCTGTPEYDPLAYVELSLSHVLTASGPHSWHVQPNIAGAPTMPCWSFTSP